MLLVRQVYNFNVSKRIITWQNKVILKKKRKQSSEITEKVLYINRCSKVVKGGRKFSFSALILVGDGKGRIGYGFAKANELTDAIRKGGEAARKEYGQSFPWKAPQFLMKLPFIGMERHLLLKPAPEGAGVIAGSKVRAVLEMAGYKDVMAKSLGASNPINQVKAIFKALSKLQKLQKIKQMRGLGMITLGSLKNPTRKRRSVKRVGRGPGSGKGKTCGRGEKGAGARSGYKRRYGYEGGQFRTFMKLPIRGFSNAMFRKLKLNTVNLCSN